MEEIILLLQTDPAKAFQMLRSQQKDPKVIADFIKEYEDMDRTLRQTQVDQIQEDKKVGEKVVAAVRLAINYQEKIVSTSVAFEVGEPVTLIPQYEGKTESNLAKLVKQLWKTNRIDNLIQKAVTIKKSQTQCAFVFYIADIKEGSIIQKVLSFLGLANQKKEIKISLLESKKGTMSPYFDSLGNLVAFTWDFVTKDAEDKEVKNSWIYTDNDVYKSVNDAAPIKEPHGFGKMPIVYIDQDKPEYYRVQPLIDRQEVTLSKFCDSNDRTAYPLLKTFGKQVSLPDKNANGKVLNFPMEWNEEAQKFVHGDAEFLSYANAPEAVKLEFETIDDLISYGSSTPITSLNKLKGIGNVAEKTVKLMFLDPIIKAKSNEGDNRTMIERLLNVMISGIVTTTNTNFKAEAQKLYFDVQFNSILPGDLTEASEVATKLSDAGLASKKTLVEFLGMNENVQEEMDLIQADADAKAVEVPAVV